MTSKELVIFMCAGLGMLALGIGMTRSVRLATWAIRNGRGRAWARLLGEARAIKLTRYFFGPLVAGMGIVVLFLGVVMLMTPTPNTTSDVPAVSASEPVSEPKSTSTPAR